MHLQTFKLEKNDRQAGCKVGMIWPGKANFSSKALTLPVKQHHLVDNLHDFAAQKHADIILDAMLLPFKKLVMRGQNRAIDA